MTLPEIVSLFPRCTRCGLPLAGEAAALDADRPTRAVHQLCVDLNYRATQSAA